MNHNMKVVWVCNVRKPQHEQQQNIAFVLLDMIEYNNKKRTKNVCKLVASFIRIWNWNEFFSPI